ncbi:hypothetical protein [Peterkaempfera griseoplana]|uniref:hypothetical protein n=1 Tax=Peterkaempfera griseoplana TaxID=66896 RepID=UPI0006E34F05|nr:hypothetical protein [Peterkaempfera griseoplana]BCN13459.1 hypothetical protein [Peterkaempfera griseoplana]
MTASAGAWLDALDGLFLIPEPYRDEGADRAAALATLRCPEGVLDRLVAAGLPVGSVAGEQRFDWFDLFNLALAAGSGQSLPEVALRYSLRWMHGGAAAWTGDAEWSFCFVQECARPGGCGADPVWEHALPVPEAAGGALLTLDARPPGATVDDAVLRSTGPGPARIEGQVRTTGRSLELVSPRLRGIVADFMARDYRWLRIPEPLQADHPRLFAAGVAPCISASLFLEGEFRAAGYRVRTRRGWILGLLDLEHAWVEVEDDDGEVKQIDPVFARLTRYAAEPHPALAAACMGSRLNRLLPTALPADGRPSRHWCDGAESAPRTATTLRRLAARPAEGGVR